MVACAQVRPVFPLSSGPELPTVADDVDSSGLDQGSKRQQQFGDPNQPAFVAFPPQKTLILAASIRLGKREKERY